MHRSPKLLGCKSIRNTPSITPLTLLDFLTPALPSRHSFSHDAGSAELLFYSALSRAGTCHTLRAPYQTKTERWDGCRRSKATKIKQVHVTSQRRSVSTEAIRRESVPTAEDPDTAYTKSRQKGNPWSFFDSTTLDFASKSRLPAAFFHDVDKLQKRREDGDYPEETGQSLVEEQMHLMQSVRELEDKLARAKSDLNASMKKDTAPRSQTPHKRKERIVLSREDYKNLVDLYYHSMRTRFDPENSDYSPTPKFLEDYSFALSEDFAPPQAYADFYNHEKDYRSPLEWIATHMRGRTLDEIRVTQAFIDLLLDDNSSNGTLFLAYKRLPRPGVAFLPRGTVSVFLQRMATPWQKSEISMIRYLTLIDDMQEAGLPIRQAEWASAVYLAGRSFKKVTQEDAIRGFQIWKQMEQEAGVKAHNVTFNILFDLAVRSNMYVLAQRVLKEMHDRGLRLNRLGRVSVIFYHGLRKDGDAIRKAYRDFVDAGEIVDTLVLNCVIASLLNAEEPSAAEQIYERMKSLYSRIHVEQGDDGGMTYYKRYPGPGEQLINREMASNHLKRILMNSWRLKDILPEHHTELQEIMPLVPDHTTFRTMISYHANVSGDLNRIVILMRDMSEMFGLPLQSITFQLLFKGFALHGGSADPDATWGLPRLDAVWDVCRNAIKERQEYKRAVALGLDSTLPSMKEVNQTAKENQERGSEGNLPVPSPVRGLKRLSTWDDFVIDLAVFPRQRRKHIERVHAQLFDEEKGRKNSLMGKEQETYYALGDSQLDAQEGEYVLPPPSLAIDPDWAKGAAGMTSPFFAKGAEAANDGHEPPSEGSFYSEGIPDPDSDASDLQRETEFNDGPPAEPKPDPDSRPETSRMPHQVRPTQSLVCWLLRAYTRCTGSRRHVEEIYNSVRKVWRPSDAHERDNVLRVLTRCLSSCDMYGPPSRLSNDQGRIRSRR